MTSFDQALTHVLDVLAHSDAKQFGRASGESLQRLIEASRGKGQAQAVQTQTTAQPRVERPFVHPQNPPQNPPGNTQQRPSVAAPRPPAPAPEEAAQPRRKLGLADQLRAAMAAGTKPVYQEPEPAPSPAPSPIQEQTPAPTPAPTAPRPPSIPSHLPPEAQLEQLCEHIMAEAYDPRTIVLGEGSARSELVFVGSSPGDAELSAGSPIAGEVGELLSKIIATMKLRKADLYITNVLKSPAAAPGHPSAREVAAELPILLSEIEIIRPKCIVALGSTALAALVGKTDSIHDLRGEWHSFRGTPVMATFHPSYLCENESKAERRKFWEDMLQVLELLAKPITPRQREFFK